MKLKDLTPGQLRDATDKTPINPQKFLSLPKHDTLPVIPRPVIENGVVVAWNIPTTMTKDGVTHTVVERYDCKEDERLSPDDPENCRVLERGMVFLVNEKGVLERCAQELEVLVQSNAKKEEINE